MCSTLDWHYPQGLLPQPANTVHAPGFRVMGHSELVQVQVSSSYKNECHPYMLPEF